MLDGTLTLYISLCNFFFLTEGPEKLNWIYLKQKNQKLAVYNKIENEIYANNLNYLVSQRHISFGK